MPQTRPPGDPDSAQEPEALHAERGKTDLHLHTERQNADRALAESTAALEHEADLVVDRARQTADAVLLTAREDADELLAQPSPGAEAEIQNERALADQVLEGERNAADRRLLVRRQRARELLALLPFERETTDTALHSERGRSDDAIANRDDLLGVVSHDLRDLLGGIVSTAHLVSRQAGDGSEGAQTRGAVERIQRLAARMNRLITDLVDVASIDAGKLGVAPVPGDLAALIAEAVETCQPAAAAKGLSLDMATDQRSLAAAFDFDRMLQVLANLVTNAIKFTPPGGSIHIRAEAAQKTVELSVRDTGRGIPPDLLEAVFERFRQVDGFDRRGLGLGLYISRRLVEAHEGRMWAESDGDGMGTTIRITLPRAPASA